MVSGSLLSKRIPLDHSCALQASATALLIASASPLLLLSLPEDAIAHLTATPKSKAKQSKAKSKRAKDAGRKNRKQTTKWKERTNAKGNTEALVPPFEH
jgi:hypothetical protein